MFQIEFHSLVLALRLLRPPSSWDNVIPRPRARDSTLREHVTRSKQNVTNGKERKGVEIPEYPHETNETNETKWRSSAFANQTDAPNGRRLIHSLPLQFDSNSTKCTRPPPANRRVIGRPTGSGRTKRKEDATVRLAVRFGSSLPPAFSPTART